MITKTDIKHQANELRAILNEWDFISVLPGEGGPEDEYDDLNAMLLSFFYDIPNKDLDLHILKRFLENKIKGHFGMGGYVVNCAEQIDKYAKKILDWWKSENRY